MTGPAPLLAPNKVTQPPCPCCHKSKAAANCWKKGEERSTDFVDILPVLSQLKIFVFHLLAETKQIVSLTPDTNVLLQFSVWMIWDLMNTIIAKP